jgi:hypothetical protein
MKVIRSVSRIIFITLVSDEGYSRNVSYAYTELNIYECLGQILLDYLAFQSFDYDRTDGLVLVIHSGPPEV